MILAQFSSVTSNNATMIPQLNIIKYFHKITCYQVKYQDHGPFQHHILKTSCYICRTLYDTFNFVCLKPLLAMLCFWLGRGFTSAPFYKTAPIW